MPAWFRILLLLFCCPCAGAQAPYLLHFTVKDGLPSNVCYNLLQDSYGFLWICTDQGVCRYDGHDFKTFSVKDGLPDNEVVNIIEDRQQRLWLVCYNDRPCYIRNGRVYNSSNDSLCRQLEEPQLRYKFVFQAAGRNVYLSGNSTWQADSSRLYPYHTGLRLVSYFFQHRGRPYAVTDKGLFRVDREQLTPILAPDPQPPYLAQYHNGHLLLYAGYNRGSKLYRVALDSNVARAVHEQPLPYRVYSMYACEDGTVQLGTDRGVIRYSLPDRRLDTSRALLRNTFISGILRDKDNNFWYSSHTDGLYLYPYTQPRIYNHEQGLLRNDVLSLCSGPAGELVAGYDNGSIDIISPGGIRTFSAPLTGGRNRVLRPLACGKGHYLAGADQGLFLLNGSRLQHLGHPSIKSLFLKNDTCYIAALGGVVAMNIHTRGQRRIWSHKTTAVAADDTGACWLGTLEGLYCQSRGAITKLEKDPVLSASRITDIGLCRGVIAIGTHEHGLFLWNGRRLTHLDESTGLSDNCCRNLCTDGQNEVWVCTGKGLDRITVTPAGDGQIRHLSFSDGLPDYGINDAALSGNDLCVATADGIILLNRNSLRADPAPAVYITALQKGDSSFFPRQRVVFGYGKKGLQISFTGVSISGGRRLRYKYLLQGAGEDTVYTALSSVNFSNIRPGAYTFLVWAGNRSGAWSPQPAACSFVIKPPFWQSPWFPWLMAGLLAAGGYGLYRYRVQGIRRRADEKARLGQRMAELEMQALRAQINPHFVFNALNSIQHYYNRHDERSANRYMTAFAQLIRQTFTHSQTHWITLSEEMEMLHTYLELEQMRFKQQFRYTLEMVPPFDDPTVLLPAMLLQPYVENAINHGLRHLKERPGLLHISFALSGTELICRIEDNGVGRGQAPVRPTTHQSRGMTITLKRIETINQLYWSTISVQVTDAPEHGTRVEIRSPVYHTQNHYRYEYPDRRR